MMDYKAIIGIIVILTGIIIEAIYSPRLYFERGKTLLFYTIPFSNKRVYKILK